MAHLSFSLSYILCAGRIILLSIFESPISVKSTKMSAASSPGLPERTGSAPTTFTPAPLATRSASPGGRYPYRTVDEMTELMRPPVVEPRDDASLPATRAERRAAGARDTPNDWHMWDDENRPVRTPWRGYDLSWSALQGDVEDPNETAAVPSETVMESIELESDPLVALRSMARDNQATVRGELAIRVELEDIVREQVMTIRRLRRERRELRADREVLRQERDAAMTREDALQARQNRLEFQRVQLEGERRQYLHDLDWYRDGNVTLQEEARELTAQLTAARALLANRPPVVQPPVAQPPVNAAPIIQPPVVQPPVAVVSAGAVRGGRRGRASGGARGGVRGGPRGRAGRGARGGAPTGREQHARSCKVVKNYRE